MSARLAPIRTPRALERLVVDVRTILAVSVVFSAAAAASVEAAVGHSFVAATSRVHDKNVRRQWRQRRLRRLVRCGGRFRFR